MSRSTVLVSLVIVCSLTACVIVAQLVLQGIPKLASDEPFSRPRKRPPALVDLGEFPEWQREAARAVAASLSAGHENPKEFYATVEAEDEGRILRFHLYHESAFLPKYRGVAGNPGGKCRDVSYDVVRMRVTETGYWQ